MDNLKEPWNTLSDFSENCNNSLVDKTPIYNPRQRSKNQKRFGSVIKFCVVLICGVLLFLANTYLLTDQGLFFNKNFKCVKGVVRKAKEEKVLVTGIAGFIGSHVAKHCQDLGFIVYGIDDMSGGFIENIPAHVTFLKGDFRDTDFLKNVFETHGPFEFIYHIGAYAAEGLSHFISSYNYDNNLEGSIKLINYAIRTNASAFIFTSSIAAYGALTPPFVETMSPHPEDPYGISKYAVELDLQSKHDMFGLNYIIFRPHNVYGSHQNIFDKYRNVIGIFMYNLLNDLPIRIFGDGEQTRAFSYINDVAPYIARAPLMNDAYNEIFNIGASTPYTLNTLADSIIKSLSKSTEVIHEPSRLEVKHAEASHLKFQTCFDPEKPYDLQKGLNEMAEWVLSNGRNYHPVTFDGLELNQGKLPQSWATENDYITDNVRAHTEASGQYQEKGSKTGDKTLLVVPGHGTEQRFDILKQSIDKIFEHGGENIDCLIWNYNLEYKMEQIRNCEVKFNADTNWPHFMELTTPTTESYDYVIVLLDDIEVISFNWTDFKNIMQRNNVTAAEPMCKGSVWGITNGARMKTGKIGIFTEFMEIQMNVFTRDAYKCFTGIMDTEINKNGWDYDLAYKALCPWVNIAIIHEYQVLHEVSSVTNNRNEAKSQARAWIAKIGLNEKASPYKDFGPLK